MAGALCKSLKQNPKNPTLSWRLQASKACPGSRRSFSAEMANSWLHCGKKRRGTSVVTQNELDANRRRQ
jgi:hypothetical protein